MVHVPINVTQGRQPTK